MAKGFYHPDRGYWQAGDDITAAAIAAYPAGTTEVPVRPSPDHSLVNGVWENVTPVVSGDAIKAEAYRRIVVFAPEWYQRNLTAQAAVLAEKGRANWTTDETTAWAAGLAIWARVAAIRAASNDLEAIDPIPSDYTDNAYWPE